jgi:23S rRNA pseudouridine1911/1915/1917 synthase
VDDPSPRREVIPAALAGERLDRVVAMLLGSSRAVAGDLVDGGGVRIDDVVVTQRSARLAEGNVIELDAVPDAVDERPVAEPDVEVVVVHADDDVVVIDKPAHLVVHPGAGNRHGTLVSGLLARYPEIAGVGDPERPGIVHRLDRGTSGLLAVARTQAAYEGLVAQLSGRTVEREYLALVRGTVDPPVGAVDAPIGRSRRMPTRMTVASDGRPARTRYELVRTYEPGPVSLVRCHLETGRTHQIRVHLLAIGHPVVGDDVYADGRPDPAPAAGLDRLFLHAAKLGFDHPVHGGHLAFESPLPDELESVLRALDQEI